MALSNQEVAELAKAAVVDMFKIYGPDHTFPFDAIWQYVPAGIDIPSNSRPHQSRTLINQRYLEKTGGMTKAASDKRAGSATPEYRFGEALVKRAKAAPSPPASTGGQSPSALLQALQQAMESDGYVISAAELANFYLAMMASPLVILSGISGTGKSLLPRKFAELTKSSFQSIAVQPQWSDNSDLFGYVPTLTPTVFVEGRLIESLLEAKSAPSKLVIAVLDEMNLAPVEHYFSDFLSVAETRVRRGSAIETDPLPIELPKPRAEEPDEFGCLRGIGLPHNLRVIGTANMDESTHSFSPKVLDRAFTIEFDDPDLTVFATEAAISATTFEPLASIVVNVDNAITIREASARSQLIFEEVAQLLAEVQTILAPAGIKFGYRTRDAILLYIHFWQELDIFDVLTSSAALDFCILQKILPKIAGSGDALADVLTKLQAWLEKGRSKKNDLETEVEAELDSGALRFAEPFMRSAKKVERMLAQLESDGATHYWGT